jgi:AraC family transcriptional regulator
MGARPRQRNGDGKARSFEEAAPTDLHFVRYDSGAPVPDALADSVVHGSSRGLGWDGLVAELGTSHTWEVENLTFSGHFVGVNRADCPLVMETKLSRGERRVSLVPWSLWLNPSTAPFTVRNCGVSHWGAVEVSPEKVRRVLGSDIEPRQTLGVVDEPLAAVLRALLFEVSTGGGSGALFADSLAVALVTRLAVLSGAEAAIGLARGLLPQRLKMVIERIEDLLGAAVTVEELAAIAQLSPAHFAREFKRCTKETPHGFVTRRRLERARQQLLKGKSIVEVANDLGFCDQAHLSRLFKRHFGLTPGAFVRSTGGKRRRSG